MKVQNRILILVVTVLVSMGLIAAISLSVLRSNMMSELDILPGLKAGDSYGAQARH